MEVQWCNAPRCGDRWPNCVTKTENNNAILSIKKIGKDEGRSNGIMKLKHIALCITS